MRRPEPGHSGRGGPTLYGRWASLGIPFIALAALWLTLSGHYRTPHLVMGVLSVAAVLLLNRDIFRPQAAHEGHTTIVATLVAGWRWIAYLAWLLYSIAIANIQVASLVLHPHMPIDPVLVRFRVSWLKDTARVALANSITLTPGTITVDLKDGQYTVHTLAPSLAQPLATGQMQNKIASVFREKIEEPEAVIWIGSVKALEP